MRNIATQECTTWRRPLYTIAPSNAHSSSEMQNDRTVPL